jgi:hypothetical protein
MSTKHWVLTHGVESKQGSEVLRPFIQYFHHDTINISNVFSLDEATITSEEVKENIGDALVFAVEAQGFKNVRWEEVSIVSHKSFEHGVKISVNEKNTTNKTIWVVSITDETSIVCSGSENQIMIPDDGTITPIIPAISTFIFDEYNDRNIVECVNAFLKVQNIEEQVYEDDIFQVIKDSDDLKMYKVKIEAEDDEEEEYEIYIQVEKKILN